MIISYPLLKMLADGEVHQASALTLALSASGHDLVAQLAMVDAMGLSVLKVHDTYQLARPLDLLDEAVVRGTLGEATNHLNTLEIALTCDSTNQVLIDRVRDARIHGTALFAEQQLRGRGRLGRVWVSPLANNIYLSLAWCFPGGARGLQGLSLAVGVAAADAIKACTGLTVQLKWPNDIYLAGKKCGGILIEMAGDPTADTVAVIGVGLNVSMPTDAANEIDQPWSDIQSVAGQHVSRSVLGGALLAALINLVRSYEEAGFSQWRRRWAELDYLRGQHVVVDGLVKLEGTAAGINEEGALMIQTSTGLEAVFGGEASIRKMRSS